MINVNEYTDSELRERAKTLSDSLRRLKIHGTQDDIDEVQASLDIVQEERERRYALTENEQDHGKSSS